MPAETTLRNARIVLSDEVIEGSLSFTGAAIDSVSSGPSGEGIDLEGDYLIPGLVELHTDHLENHFAPRPKVRWNAIAAVMAHDAQIAASGITTVFDALRVGNTDGDHDLVTRDMVALAEAIHESNQADRLRAEHFIHLRCEVSSPDCLTSFEMLGGRSGVRLASLMDHAPGQRQFANLDTYRTYYQGKLKMSDEAFDRFCKERVAQSETYAKKHREAIAAVAREQQIVLASHDDATEDHVAEAVKDGVRVAEFPTTVVAANASRNHDMSVLMGAPNVVRGGSHSGNVAAQELAERGCLDILSSDYVPCSLLQAAFMLAENVESINLPAAIRMASLTPARAVHLDDRGAIEPGKRADLVQVRLDNGIPVVRAVWRQGRRVA